MEIYLSYVASHCLIVNIGL